MADRSTPRASSPQAAKRMRATRQRDTEPERAVRSALHRMGLRYRVHRRPISGLRRRADIVFPTERVAVFVDGCFWHGCPEHATTPRANRAWWVEKLASNRSRDRDTDERLAEASWTVLRFWEHENPLKVANEIRTLVLSKRK